MMIKSEQGNQMPPLLVADCKLSIITFLIQKLTRDMKREAASCMRKQSYDMLPCSLQQANFPTSRNETNTKFPGFLSQKDPVALSRTGMNQYKYAPLILIVRDLESRLAPGN
ncbi:hypothetical protein EUGRSUZ_F03912 [Eucalyptus grandis]|uniref:Uncharacterized protein n=2 Tax=Eucalyptus grandis TaxID=71139 RepID=A0ACC3KN68_EUCGR|nr:hypothetical protein EUGRSUZ_F03912 [Eucalyptus grandis]